MRECLALLWFYVMCFWFSCAVLFLLYIVCMLLCDDDSVTEVEPTGESDESIRDVQNS